MRRVKGIRLQGLDYLLDQSWDYFVIFDIQYLQGLVMLHGLDHDPPCAVLQIVLAQVQRDQGSILCEARH